MKILIFTRVKLPNLIAQPDIVTVKGADLIIFNLPHQFYLRF